VAAFSFLRPGVKNDAKLSASDQDQDTPLYEQMIITRINSTVRRRFADRVEALLRASCLGGDLETAGDLLTVLERLQERGRCNVGRERRVSDDPVARARDELVRAR
jgi:hypothetical protein